MTPSLHPSTRRARFAFVAWLLVMLGALSVTGCENIDSSHNCSVSCGANGMRAFRYVEVGSGCAANTQPLCECNPPASTTDGGTVSR